MSNLPATYNLVVYRGDSWAQVFRFKQGSTPVNLTGATIAAQMKNRSSGTTASLVATVTNALNGEVTLKMPATPPKPGQYVYDVEVTLAGQVTTWVHGSLTLNQDVTNEQP